jgi:hypothetical protein
VYYTLLRDIRSDGTIFVADAERVTMLTGEDLYRVERIKAMIDHLDFCLVCGWCVLGMLIDCIGTNKTIRAVGVGCGCCTYRVQVLDTVAKIWKVTLK